MTAPAPIPGPYRPRFPVYVISKGRSTPGSALTVKCLLRNRVDFRLVVEPQEAADYAKLLPPELRETALTVLPFSNLGQGSIPARNFVWEHALRSGAERHWILDDNLMCFRRLYRGRRYRCPAGPALWAAEHFTDRHDGIGITGFNYHMFGIPGPSGKFDPLRINAHVYSCLLIDGSLPFRWRGRYNEDTDLCLQVITAGRFTVQINSFMIMKVQTMRMKGGNTEELYRGDGRLLMARSLERMWPGIVTVDRRFGRPQHVVNWARFRAVLPERPGPHPAPADPDLGLRLSREFTDSSPRPRRALALVEGGG